MDFIHAALQNQMVRGALTGLTTAVLIDLHAWYSSDGPTDFNVNKALKRYVAGIMSGSGINAVFGVM
jgi:hypothetical protein